MNKKPIIAAALALTLTIGATSAAYAWGGGFGHHESSSSHRVMEHGRGKAPAHQQSNTIAFNQHGGGHEDAGNNAAIHTAEMSDPKHQDRDLNAPAVSYEQHGGGHEDAADNASTHEREMQNPNHKD